MQPHTPPPAGFKRQIVFRIGAEDWPALEAAAREHGSIQAAVLAGIRAFANAPDQQPTDAATPTPSAQPKPPPRAARKTPVAAEAEPSAGANVEITAREAASLLGLKASTIRGYIRSGRLPGRYDAEPTRRGWLTTRAAVTAYRRP